MILIMFNLFENDDYCDNDNYDVTFRLLLEPNYPSVTLTRSLKLSCFDFRFCFQVLISHLDFTFRFQVWILGLDFKFGFQVWISGSDFRFRFQVLDFKLQISSFRSQGLDFRIEAWGTEGRSWGNRRLRKSFHSNLRRPLRTLQVQKPSQGIKKINVCVFSMFF